MPKRSSLSRLSDKFSTKTVCFGTIEKDEWHADFGLLPKDQRSYAAMKFIAAARAPHIYTSTAFVFDPVLVAISIRKQPQSRLYVGDIVR